MTNFIIYGKSNCKFCEAAKSLCEAKSFVYEYINVEDSVSLKDELLKKVNRYTCIPPRTVPQIFMVENGNEAYIGGFDNLKELLK
jgi:glutaredoxin 1